jgi:type IV secretory pathway TrbF-like protein
MTINESLPPTLRALRRTPEPETPYLKAAQVWDERIGSPRVQAKNWRLMAFGSLVLAGGFAAGWSGNRRSGTVVPVGGAGRQVRRGAGRRARRRRL